MCNGREVAGGEEAWYVPADGGRSRLHRHILRAGAARVAALHGRRGSESIGHLGDLHGIAVAYHVHHVRHPAGTVQHDAVMHGLAVAFDDHHETDRLISQARDAPSGLNVRAHLGATTECLRGYCERLPGLVRGSEGVCLVQDAELVLAVGAEQPLHGQHRHRLALGRLAKAGRLGRVCGRTALGGGDLPGPIGVDALRVLGVEHRVVVQQFRGLDPGRRRGGRAAGRRGGGRGVADQDRPADGQADHDNGSDPSDQQCQLGPFT